MISNEALEQFLKQDSSVTLARVSGDGYHYSLTIVSDKFKDLSKLARHKVVYALLKDYITSGRLHALSMQTWTEAEWEKQGE